MFQFSEDKDIIFACQVPRLPGPPNSPRVVEADRSLSCRRRRRHALLRLLERQVIRNDDESFFYYYMTRYEDDMVIVGNYNGYVKCAEAFLRLGLSHQVSEKSFVCGFAQVCVYHCAIDGCFTDSILGANSGHGCWHRCITLHPACSIFWILALWHKS